MGTVPAASPVGFAAEIRAFEQFQETELDGVRMQRVNSIERTFKRRKIFPGQAGDQVEMNVNITRRKQPADVLHT